MGFLYLELIEVYCKNFKQFNNLFTFKMIHLCKIFIKPIKKYANVILESLQMPYPQSIWLKSF